MGSSSKRRQTFSKMTRERAVKEKRAAKQEKKEERKRLAAEAAEGGGILATEDVVLGEDGLPIESAVDEDPATALNGDEPSAARS